MADTITITVDGVEHEVSPQQPLIDAIRETGTDVPNFCYHLIFQLPVTAAFVWLKLRARVVLC